MRRANSETYQVFSGRTSIAARIPWRVLGSKASRGPLLRILRSCLRNMRECQVAITACP